jgi:DNA-3-methyladenine glycosylase II
MQAAVEMNRGWEPAPATVPVAVIQRTGELRCRAPFELRHSLAFLGGFGPMRDEQRIARGVLTKAVMVQGQAVVWRVFQLQPDGDRAAPGLRCALYSERPIDADTDRAAVERLAFFLSTDEDLGPFYAMAARDAALAPVVQRLRGLHHVKFPSPFEAACWGVLNQRIGVAASRRMKDAISQTLGARVTVDGAAYFAFPEAAEVARCAEGRLSALLGSDRKAKAVHAVSRAFANVRDAFLRDADHDELKAWLEGIYGVGPFTTGFVLYRGLGRFERVPMSPKFTLAAQKVYGRALSSSDLLRLFERYGPWGGQWALYVWASTFV